ncbi:MAG: DegT/DnrJ/EryC1/StrS family aminotransferase [Bacteroidales bacterium]|nr:DegT/DnrJ/EryC1/StrS family aminotransferase [Bacteroidales bacterium]
MKIPFSPPFIDEDVLNEVSDTLKSGWITTGPKVKALETEISKLAEISNVLCVNSATSGLMLALHWFGVGEGDEVIVPSYTYAATALAVIHVGAKPIMVDIKDDFTIDTSELKKKITTRTKAIIPVDIAGWPADYDTINQIVKNEEIIALFKPESLQQKQLGRILVLSDAAHSIGAIYKGKTIGSLCDLTVFSLHAVKNVTTAEGGAICINLPKPFSCSEVYENMRLMCLNGQTKDAFTKNKAGGWRYDIALLGYKMNMPDVCAAIGLAQIRKYKTVLLPERKRVALKYSQLFANYEWAHLPLLIDNETETSFHIYPLRIKNITENERDLIIEEISKEGIAVNVHFIPMPMLTLFKGLGYKIDDYPVAYDNYSREISLPIYPQLTNAHVKLIVAQIVKAYLLIVNNHD